MFICTRVFFGVLFRYIFGVESNTLVSSIYSIDVIIYSDNVTICISVLDGR